MWVSASIINAVTVHENRHSIEYLLPDAIMKRRDSLMLAVAHAGRPHLGAFQCRFDGLLPHHHPHCRPQRQLGCLPQEKPYGLSCQGPYILRTVVPQLRRVFQHLHTRN